MPILVLFGFDSGRAGTSGRKNYTKKFNGEAALLFRACFHIEGDWRPFEDGILWENEGAASPVETKINIIPFNVLCNNTY